MTSSFDSRALSASALTPEQKRKVNAIRVALGSSDRAIKDHFISVKTFERSALKSRTGRITPEWPRRIGGMRAETLAVRGRLDRLNTGLRAQRTLRAALTELASGFAAWQRGLAAGDRNVVESARASAQRHFANAERLGRSGLADLKAGR
jgi:hypothetical protein